MRGLVLGALIGAMVVNFDNNDPEWRFQVGFLAEFLESGGPLPEGKALGALWRISGKKMLTRNEIVRWARSQEKTLN